jgi:hypothetical protein
MYTIILYLIQLSNDKQIIYTHPKNIYVTRNVDAKIEQHVTTTTTTTTVCI